MTFMSAIKDTLDNEMNVSITENGALGFRTSGKALLDLNFSAGSLRSASEEEIFDKFMNAFVEDKILAMRWLFFARDRDKGLGERRLFRAVMKRLVTSNPEVVKPLIPLMADFGRYDDLYCLVDTALENDMFNYMKQVVARDVNCILNGEYGVSLIFKWLKSETASSKETKRLAKKTRKAFGMSAKDYRKMLSAGRRYLDVTEVKMSAKQWSEIDYEKVPSKANLLYRNAFLKNDEERRREYLNQLSKGEVKINASVLYPHDIVHKYTDGLRRLYKSKDDTIEALWKALPDNVNGCDNTIVVADGSGSMACCIDRKSSVTALDVANALAIYFAEHSSGEFKDKYITFSSRPQLVDFSHCTSLREKIQTALQHNEVANTNIEAVFDLILQTAIKNNMSQEDMPKNILIVSDMEFDYMVTKRPDQKMFDAIAERYREADFSLPRLVFWNTNNRTGTIPMKENELGVALVSGFSTNICKMVMSGKTDPYECLLETLNDKRYDVIESALTK